VNRLTILERRDPLGAVVAATWLLEDAGALSLEDSDHPGTRRALPITAVTAIFARYGKPLAAAAPPLAADDQQIPLTLPTGASATVRAFSFRGWGSVLPEDYLLLTADGAEPLAAPAPLVAAALSALAR
jgi:hypothetical protein